MSNDPRMDDWATHVPALTACLAATTGPVLEVGAGIWSTPILHAACAPTRRHLLTMEGKPEWLARFLPMATPWHELRAVGDWTKWEVPCGPSLLHWDGPAAGSPEAGTRPGVALMRPARWALAFVDHGYAPRGPVVAALRGHADIVVMHDSECHYCGYTAGLAGYDWVYTHAHSPTWTTIAGMGERPAWLESGLAPGIWGVPAPYRG